MTKRLPTPAAVRLWVVTHPATSVVVDLVRRARVADIKADLVFVLPPPSAPGWILEAICREVGSRLSSLDIRYCHHGNPLPPAHRYFFSHYAYYVGALSQWASVRRGASYVFATHLDPEKHGIPNAQLARALDISDGVICMNEALRAELESLGVSHHRLSVAVGAASADIYRPHARTYEGTVGFCSAYYARKSPELILQLVQRMPHRKFVLLGRDWAEYGRFSELLEQANFRYVEAPYSDYPLHYSEMTVFVSASQLEGGPIPLLEAMMSNCVPVVTSTGFAPDIIRHGENGFLFEPRAGVEEIAGLIERAYSLDADIAATVSGFDWKPYAARIAHIMGVADPSSRV